MTKRQQVIDIAVARMFKHRLPFEEITVFEIMDSLNAPEELLDTERKHTLFMNEIKRELNKTYKLTGERPE